jgi:hypothetical protein
MRIPLILSTLTLAVLSFSATAENRRDDFDKQSIEILKKTGDLHKNAKSLHVDAVVTTEIENNGEKQKVKADATIDLERPTKFALKTRLDGKADNGPDIVSDGKKMVVHSKKQKQYTEVEVDNLPDVGVKLLQVGTPFTGILFQNVLAEDPYEALMDGVTAVAYAGKEKVDGIEAHHLKFEQPGLLWELWIAAKDKPVVLKALSTREGGGFKATTIETYKNWKFDEASAKDAYKFTPGESKKVEELERENQ